MGETLRKAQLREEIRGALTLQALWDSVRKHHREHYILDRAECCEQVEGLKYIPDVLGAKAVAKRFGQTRDIGAGDLNRAGGRSCDACDQIEERGFSRAA